MEKEGKGGGTLTASGSPYNAFAVVVKITAQGTLNTAAFAYSIDGGNNFSDEITVPVAGKYELPGTGLTITFAAVSEEADSSFQVGDMWSFSTTAPAMTKGDALAAAARLKTSRRSSSGCMWWAGAIWICGKPWARSAMS